MIGAPRTIRSPPTTSSWNQTPSANILCSKSSKISLKRRKMWRMIFKCWVKEGWKLRLVKMLVMISVFARKGVLFHLLRKRKIRATWQLPRKKLEFWTCNCGFMSCSNRPQKIHQILSLPFKLLMNWQPSKSLSDTQPQILKAFSKSKKLSFQRQKSWKWNFKTVRKICKLFQIMIRQDQSMEKKHLVQKSVISLKLKQNAHIPIAKKYVKTCATPAITPWANLRKPLSASIWISPITRVASVKAVTLRHTTAKKRRGW